MKFIVLYSKQDQAGVNIASQLKDLFIDIPIIELEKDSIYNENIDKQDKKIKDLNPDFIIFATKHQSKAQIPSLSIHAPGNWRSNDFGGKPGKVCNTSSQILKFLFQKLNENANAKSGVLKGYSLSLECTHHGPYIETPCCFIEIGSNKSAWQNKELGKIIAKTISDIKDFKPQTRNKIKTSIAIGGPHYCPNFNKIQLSSNSNIAISHIIPEYQLPLTQSMLNEAIEKTTEGVDLILLDWKGCGNSESRQEIVKLLDSLGLDYERVERVEK